MVKISIIVPVYNVEKYLKKCLDSLVNQTLQDLEIICINDGSTDGSLEILNSYAQKDLRIKVLSQENSKQGAARNRGLEIATGEFISFIDSDDWVDLDFYEKMLNSIENNDIDFALSEAVRIKKNGETRPYFKFNKSEIILGFDNIIKVNKIPEYWHVWGKLYKKELLENILFEEGVFYEDPEFLIKVLHKTNKIITVPNAKYYYYTNPKSTMKLKHSVAKKLDQINSMLKVIDYAKNHNLTLPNILITVQRHLLYTLKYYEKYKELYVFGKKVKRINEEYNTKKHFVIFNTACFGDVLLCNSLCQNIKATFPKSHISFVVNKGFEDVAKYQKDVDEVIVYDKKGIHKGFFGMLKFVKDFGYKKPFASFITYKNERNTLIAKLLRSKFVITPLENCEDELTQVKHNKMLTLLTNKKIHNYPIVFDISDNIGENTLNTYNLPEKFIVLCAISKNPTKDMPIDTAIKIINEINLENKYKIVVVGAGKDSKKFAKDLEDFGCKFVNLVDKTTIRQLASVLKKSIGLISVDTGIMHLGCALKVPTVAVFYEQMTIKNWAPRKELYNSALICQNQTAENILSSLNNLITGEETL